MYIYPFVYEGIKYKKSAGPEACTQTLAPSSPRQLAAPELLKIIECGSEFSKFGHPCYVV